MWSKNYPEENQDKENTEKKFDQEILDELKEEFDKSSNFSEEQSEFDDLDIKTVFVTGANGYLGSWIVFYLLKNNYSVKASVRCLKETHRYDHLLALDEVKKNPHKLQIVEAKLEDTHIWPSLLLGTQAIIHTASPNPYFPLKNPLDLIYPSVEGTLSLLHAAHSLKIKYFILTGSLSNIGTCHRKIYTESTYATLTNLSPYNQSKLISELSANYYNKQAGNPFQLITLLPGTFFGPTLQNSLNSSSCMLFQKIMKGEAKNLFKSEIGFCDVRDVAKAHVNCLKFKYQEVSFLVWKIFGRNFCFF